MTIIDQQTGFEQKQFSSRLTTTTRSGRAIARSSLTRSFVLNFHKQTIDSPLPFQVADFKKKNTLVMNFVGFDNEEMYVFVAPDGTPQLSICGEDFAECLGCAEMMASYGLSKHPATLFNEGFQILPVKVTVVQNGTAEEGFERATDKIKKTKQ